MANSKIYLGNTNIGSLFQGASDISIYLGENKVYPLEWRGKFKATYSDGREYDLACDGNTTLTTGNTRTSDYTLSAMTEAIIGDYCVTSIGDYAFKGCISLTSCTIGSGVTSIGVEAFALCTKITSLTLPNSITNINGWAFYGCSGLTSVTIEAVTPPTLGSNAFKNSTCPIYVPCESVEAYKSASGWSDYASRITCVQPPFEGKWKATYSDSHVESAQCDSSSEIVSGEINKTNLVSVEIGDCVTSIGNSGFTIYTGLTSIDIPSGVTIIGDGAFTYCSSLTSIDIPSGVTTIGSQAFLHCSSLTSITVNAVTPPTLGGATVFNNTNNCPIYVPSASLTAYQTAWSDYASRIQAIP